MHFLFLTHEIQLNWSLLRSDKLCVWSSFNDRNSSTQEILTLIIIDLFRLLTRSCCYFDASMSLYSFVHTNQIHKRIIRWKTLDYLLFLDWQRFSLAKNYEENDRNYEPKLNATNFDDELWILSFDGGPKLSEVMKINAK